jgi:uncharacterized membrane protein YkvA (DUF1232 family)
MNNEVTMLNADDKKQSTKTPGKLLLIIAAVCLVYIFIPEPSDLIPGIGWLDEIAAGGVGLTSILDFFRGSEFGGEG